MKDWKSELEKVEFEIFRIKYEIDSYLRQCKILGFEPDEERIDRYLDALNGYLKRREELKK